MLCQSKFQKIHLAEIDFRSFKSMMPSVILVCKDGIVLLKSRISLEILENLRKIYTNQCDCFCFFFSKRRAKRLERIQIKLTFSIRNILRHFENFGEAII